MSFSASNDQTMTCKFIADSGYLASKFSISHRKTATTRTHTLERQEKCKAFAADCSCWCMVITMVAIVIEQGKMCKKLCAILSLYMILLHRKPCMSCHLAYSRLRLSIISSVAIIWTSCQWSQVPFGTCTVEGSIRVGDAISSVEHGPALRALLVYDGVGYLRPLVFFRAGTSWW